MGEQTVNRYSCRMLRACSGLSLVEAAVAISLIGIILSVLVPNVLDYYDEARKTRTIEEMSNLAKAVARYRLEEGWWPNSWESMTSRKRKDKAILGTDIAMVKTGPSSANEHPMDPWGGYYTLRAYIRRESSGLPADAVGWIPTTYNSWQASGITLLNKGGPPTQLAVNTTFEVLVMSTSRDFVGFSVDLGIPAAPPIQTYADEVQAVGAKKVVFAGMEPAVRR